MKKIINPSFKISDNKINKEIKDSRTTSFKTTVKS